MIVSGTSPLTMRCARPSTTASRQHPGHVPLLGRPALHVGGRDLGPIIDGLRAAPEAFTEHVKNKTTFLYPITDNTAKVKGIIKGAIQIIAPLTYRQRYQQSTGRDPLHCPHCHSEMGLWRIWHPVYGVIHDELEAIRRGKDTSQAPRAAPAGSSDWSALAAFPMRSRKFVA